MELARIMEHATFDDTKIERISSISEREEIIPYVKEM